MVMLIRLRLERLNEEMKDTESGITGDDMFYDVVRDFSRLSFSNTELPHKNSE